MRKMKLSDMHKQANVYWKMCRVLKSYKHVQTKI